MKFCSQCGSSGIVLRIPSGEDRQRYICNDCGTVFYQNPKIVAGAILEWQGRILLCQRAIEPRKGFWTYPGGFMENAESVVEAAGRETWEEACARADHLYLHSMYSLKNNNQVYVVYRGSLKDGKAASGRESSQVKLYAESDIPWDSIAFPVIHRTLKLFFEDRRSGQYRVHQGEISLNEAGKSTFNDYPEPA